MATIVLAAGIGVIAFTLFYYSIDAISTQILLRAQFVLPKSDNSKKIFIGGMLGFIIGVILFAGTSYTATGSMVFAGLGAGGIVAIDRIRSGYNQEQLRKECMSLFNAVGYYTLAGMSIPQSLSNSRDFLPNLTPIINRVLAAWATGSVQALEMFRQEIDLPECEQLVSLMLQVNQAGSKNIENIIHNESRHMEERRATYEKIRINRKPIILTIYRLLPLVVLLGLGCGFLVTYAFTQLDSIM